MAYNTNHIKKPRQKFPDHIDPMLFSCNSVLSGLIVFSLLAKARNRQRGNPVELNKSAEDFGGRCCPPSPRHLDFSQRICLNIDLTSVSDETDYDREILENSVMKNSEVEENAVNAVKPSFVSLKEKPVLDLNSALEPEEFSTGGPGRGATSSYVKFRHGCFKDDDIETMMSALSLSEGQGHGQYQKDERSGLDNQSKQRNFCFDVQSEMGTISEHGTDRSDQGAQKGSGQSNEELVSEPCDAGGHKSSKSKYQGTVFSSLPEKNYYEMVRSECGSRVQLERIKIPVCDDDKGEGSVLQGIKVVGVGTELAEKHVRDAGRSHDQKESRQIRVPSAGNNLLRVSCCGCHAFMGRANIYW